MVKSRQATGKEKICVAWILGKASLACVHIAVSTVGFVASLRAQLVSLGVLQSGLFFFKFGI